MQCPCGITIGRLLMKKAIRSITSFILIALLLAAAGCAGQGTQSNAENEGTPAASGDGSLEPVTLTLWHSYAGNSQTELDSAVEEFNATVGSEQGIVVEAVAMGSISDLESAVTDSAKGVINSAEMPDIFSCYADKALELDELDALCDLTEYFSETELNQYVPRFLEAGELGGKLLTLPIVAATEVLYVNKTALDEFLEANPQYTYSDDTLSTWESLYDLSQAYYAWTDAQTPETPWDGKGFMGIDELGNYMIVSNKQLGVDIMDGEAAEVRLSNDVLRKVFSLYFNGTALGYFDQVGRFCSDDVKAGDLAAYVGSSSSATYFPTFVEVDSHESPIELLSAEYPVFSGGEHFEIQQGAGMAVSKSSEARENAAAVFLKWFTDVPVNVPYTMHSGYLPVKTAAYESEEFQNTMDQFAAGTDLERNMEKVYVVALTDIADGTTFAPVTFSASYSVRSLLRRSLSDAALQGKADAAGMKEQGLSDTEILSALDTDARFEAWLAQLKDELTEMNVAYTEV